MPRINQEGRNMSKQERSEYIEVEKIDIEEQRLRYDPNDDRVIELADSIIRHGQLEEIGVAKLPNGRYQLLYGGRRLAAHKRLNRPTIRALVRQEVPESIKSIALVENLQREQLTLGEECDAVAYLHDQEAKSVDQICTILSKGRQWVLSRLMVRSFPPDIQDPLLEGRLALGAAEQIARLPDEGARRYVLAQTHQNSLSISAVRELVDAIEKTPSAQEAVEAGIHTAEQLAQPYIPTAPCQVCGETRELGDLIVLRVCRAGCNPTNHPTPTQDEDHA